MFDFITLAHRLVQAWLTGLPSKNLPDGIALF